MAKAPACPKCSSESTSRNFLHGTKTGSTIVLILGLVVVVQQPSNWLGWLMVVGGVVGFTVKRYKCKSCNLQWT